MAGVGPQVDDLVRIILEVVQLAEGQAFPDRHAPAAVGHAADARLRAHAEVGPRGLLLDDHAVVRGFALAGDDGRQVLSLHAVGGRDAGTLEDAARRAPGKLNFASAGHATGPHLVAEIIAAEAGVKFTHVPFKNVGDMYVQAINGTLDFISTTPVALTTGRGMKGLAVMGDARLPNNPEIPLLKELGFKRAFYPGLMVLGVYAPKGIPAAAATFIRGACPRALDTPLAKAAADKTATPIAHADGPAYAAGMLHDYRAIGELLDSLGIKAP